MIGYADAMTATPSTVTDEQVADLLARLGDAGLLELTYVVAQENLRSRMNTALGITAQGFSTGPACPGIEQPQETGRPNPRSNS